MKLAVYISLFLLSGCDQQYKTASAAPSTDKLPETHFQIVANSEGGAWQLDTLTGETKFCASFSPVAGGPACFKVIEK